MSINLNLAFAKEFDMFLDKRLSYQVAKFMLELPDDILDMPASVTGKYHPPDELQKDGMIIHIKRCCTLVGQVEKKYNFTKYGHDVILAGCLLHDAFKGGSPRTEHTCTEHPYLIYDAIFKYASQCSNFEIIFWTDVARACAWHEGVWTTELCRDIPQTTFGKALHDIDFFVSRREMYDIFQKEWVELKCHRKVEVRIN